MHARDAVWWVYRSVFQITITIWGDRDSHQRNYRRTASLLTRNALLLSGGCFFSCSHSEWDTWKMCAGICSRAVKHILTYMHARTHTPLHAMLYLLLNELRARAWRTSPKSMQNSFTSIYSISDVLQQTVYYVYNCQIDVWHWHLLYKYTSRSMLKCILSSFLCTYLRMCIKPVALLYIFDCEYSILCTICIAHLFLSLCID